MFLAGLALYFPFQTATWALSIRNKTLHGRTGFNAGSMRFQTHVNIGHQLATEEDDRGLKII